MKKIVTRKLLTKDLIKVASIHYRYLKFGVLSHLGENFLIKFYVSLLSQKNTFTVVALINDQVVGFATGAIKLTTIPKIMFVSLWLPAATAIIKNPLIASKLLKILFYPGFKSEKNIGEVFSLAVETKYRKMGVGTELIKKCKEEFRKRNCPSFQISVRQKMVNANIFYKKRNMIKHSSANFLGDRIIFYRSET